MIRTLVLATLVSSTAMPRSLPAPSAFGTTAESAHAVGRLEIRRTLSTATNTTDEAPLHLPSGVLITRAEAEYCASGATMTFALQQDGTNVASTSSSVSSCFALSVPVNTTFAGASVYSFRLDSTHSGAPPIPLRFRVYYSMQVSPAPERATFSDVPVGDPYHRFVEALVAAGITSGCAPGKFCPDAPLTRKQMAVFLAVALGLHYPD